MVDQLRVRRCPWLCAHTLQMHGDSGIATNLHAPPPPRRRSAARLALLAGSFRAGVPQAMVLALTVSAVQRCGIRLEALPATVYRNSCRTCGPRPKRIHTEHRKPLPARVLPHEGFLDSHTRIPIVGPYIHPKQLLYLASARAAFSWPHYRRLKAETLRGRSREPLAHSPSASPPRPAVC